MVSLQSCKDDLSDFEHRYDADKGLTNQELIDLWKFVKYGDGTDKSLEQRIDSLEKFRRQLMGMDPNAEGIEPDVKEFLKTFQGYGEDITGLSKALWGDEYTDPNNPNYKKGGLSGDVNKILTALLYNNETGKFGVVDLVNTLNTNYQTLEGTVNHKDWGNEALYDSITNGKTGNQELYRLIKELEKSLDGVIGEDGSIADINGQISGIEGQLSALDLLLNGDPETGTKGLVERVGKNESDIEQILLQLADKVDKETFNTLETNFNTLQTQFNTLKDVTIPAIERRLQTVETAVEQLLNKVATVEAKVDALMNRMDALITGIIVQRAFGPVFGDFSLPIGVQSNLLFGWYAEKTSPIEVFPTYEIESLDENLFNGLITPVAVDKLYGDDIDLGTLFLTINPAGHNFTNTKLFLEKSNGETLAAVNINPSKSDELLTFGSSRATVEGNGFYSAPVSIKYDDKGEIEVDINKNDMKDAVKAILNDPSTVSAAKLLKVVYDQINNVNKQMPAYAVRYEWSVQDAAQTEKTETIVYDENGNAVYNADGTLQTTTVETRNYQDYSVRSKYEIGIATAHPLSYNALKGEGTSKTLPTGNLQNFINKLKDKFSGKFDVNAEAKVKDHTVSIESVSFEEESGKLYAYVKGLKIDGKPVNMDKVPCKDANTAVDDVTEAIAQKFCDTFGKGKDDAWKAEATLKLNAVLLEMNNQINKIVSELKANVESIFDVEGNNYFKRVNKMFDLYNKVAKKINKFLANPNAALQVAAFYESKDGIELLSQDSKYPTQVEGTGKMKVYLTNYTGEFIVPACKKFFACTTPNNPFNDGEKINAILDGNETEVAITIPANATGKYEFVYQALDYSGYTSTKKFYIEVK